MKIYTSKNCLKCIALEQTLLNEKIPYEKIDGTTTKSIAFLRSRKLPMELPIIENDNKFYTYEQYMELLK